MDETNSENKTGQHESKTKKYFQNVKKWRREYISAAWQDTKKSAHEGKFWFELLALLVVSVYTVFAGCQVRIANKTLTEIQKGGVDTKNLAEATRDLAHASSDQWRAAIGNIILTEQFLQGGANRAWVRIEDDVRVDGRKISVHLKNYGLVPARRVTFSFIMRDNLPETWHKIPPNFVPDKTSPCTIAQNESKDPEYGSALAVFPNSEIQVSETLLSVNSHWILACVWYQDTYLENGEDSKKWPFPGHPHTSAVLYSIDPPSKKFIVRGIEIN